jgi:hypothetical protein
MAVTNAASTSLFQAPNNDASATFRQALDGDREACSKIVDRIDYVLSATSSADEIVTFDIPRAGICDTSGVSRVVVKARVFANSATAAGMQYGEAAALFCDIAGTLTILAGVASVSAFSVQGTALTAPVWSVSTTNMRLSVDSGSAVTVNYTVQVEITKYA